MSKDFLRDTCIAQEVFSSLKTTDVCNRAKGNMMGKEGRVLNFYEDVFKPTLERFPERPALSFEGQSGSYRELDRAVTEFAGDLQDMTEPSDRVCLILPNIPTFATAYLALQKIERIAVPCNPSLKKPELAHVINDTVSRMIITTDAVLHAGEIPETHEIASVRSILVFREHTDSSDGAGNASAYRCQPLPAHKKEGVGILPPPYTAAILYTSGTTGRQKGAILTQRNIITNSRAAAYYTGMTEGDRVVCFLPLFHCFGLNFIMSACFGAGAELMLFRKWDEQQVLSAAQERRATMFLSAPPVYRRLVDKAEEVKPYLASVRYFFSAAATLTEETNRRWKEAFGIPICQGYGLTETSPFATENCNPNTYREGSVGRAIRGVEIQIINPETGAVLPKGPEHVGEILIRGENVMWGYWMQPYESALALRDDWFHSGDSGWMDNDGYLYYVDRYKDMINDSGFKIWPREVEDVLHRHGGVKEAAVIGLPHPERGEIAVACVIPTDAQRALIGNDGMQWTYWARELREFCMKYLAPYKIPREFLPATEFPKSPAGKILKRVMRENFSPNPAS